MIADVIENIDTSVVLNSELYHHGTKGMHWGERHYQNKDGSLTPEGRKRYGVGQRIKKIGGAIKKKMYPRKQDLHDELAKQEYKRDVRAEKKQIKDTKLQFKRKKNIKKMTNDEIKEEMSRLELERDLKSMRESTKLSKGKEAYKAAIRDAANRTMANAIQTIGGAVANKIAKSITGDNQYKLAEREAELQLNYLDDKDKHADRRSKAGETLSDYYELISKHPKNKGGNNGKNAPSDIRRKREDAEDQMKLDILNGDKKAASRYEEYRKATGGNGKKKSNNEQQENKPKDDKPRDDKPKDDKESSILKKQLNRAEQKLKNAEQQREEARKDRDEFKQRQNQEAQRRKRAEEIAKKNAQRAASEAKIATEQKDKADRLVKAWAKHKYSDRIENPDGSYTYIYGDDYQRYMATKLGLGRMS